MAVVDRSYTAVADSAYTGKRTVSPSPLTFSLSLLHPTSVNTKLQVSKLEKWQQKDPRYVFSLLRTCLSVYFFHFSTHGLAIF